MKIAILTQPLGANYGGLMQAYALQKYLNDMGHEVTTIDRRTPNDVYIDQIMEYAEGSRREFELELDMRATPFQKSVYEFVSKIGYGEICAYSDIANAIGNPKAVRAVGAANGANPIPLIVPCHRVIARGGALQGYAGGLGLKARLLAMEQSLPEPEAEQARLF